LVGQATYVEGACVFDEEGVQGRKPHHPANDTNLTAQLGPAAHDNQGMQ
jgi:hypothetical protein